MGCDGGTIPQRKEIVKNKERQPRQERHCNTKEWDRWMQCAISNYSLRNPVVAGHYGHLFSKEALMQHYLAYKRGDLSAHHTVTDTSPALDSFHSMKDVKQLKLQDNPEAKKKRASDMHDETLRGHWVCPITGLETNGKYKFVFSWKCGCVVSQRAFKEVPNDDKCLICQTPYKPFDIVLINPVTSKELEENQAKFMCRKMQTQFDKKALDDHSLVAATTSDSDCAPSISRSSTNPKRRHEAPSWDPTGPSTSSNSKRRKP